MNTHSLTLVIAFAITLPLAACDETPTDGPPTVRLAHDLCAECNMIISDERWATATIVEGPRGPEPRLFDDFNCQVRYEHTNPDVSIITRWSHDHDSLEWITTDSAVFLSSESIMTPMGSGMAAFTSENLAVSPLHSESTKTLTFAEAWDALRP